MDNPESNNLPLLPDPLESQPTPALPTVTNTPAVSQPPSMPNHKPRRNYLRISLIFGGTALVLLLVLFGSRLVDLLNLRGTKAGTSVDLDSDNFIGGDWQSIPTSSFQIIDGKLTLSNPGQ